MEKPQMFLLDSFAHVDSLLSPPSLWRSYHTVTSASPFFKSHFVASLSLSLCDLSHTWFLASIRHWSPTTSLEQFQCILVRGSLTKYSRLAIVCSRVFNETCKISLTLCVMSASGSTPMYWASSLDRIKPSLLDCPWPDLEQALCGKVKNLCLSSVLCIITALKASTSLWQLELKQKLCLHQTSLYPSAKENTKFGIRNR